MPTTVVGLILFVAFLTPGFLNFVQRRALFPQRTPSPLVETATLIAISVGCNAVALAGFGIVRAVLPTHTPDLGRLLGAGTGRAYVVGHLPYVLGWFALAMVISCGVGVGTARWRWLRNRFASDIQEVSAWYHVFEERSNLSPPPAVYVGCEMRDGSYVAGRLDWYSTDVEETGDRDLVLGVPLKHRVQDEDESPVADFERVILSARDVVRMYVSWVDPGVLAATP